MKHVGPSLREVLANKRHGNSVSGARGVPHDAAGHERGQGDARPYRGIVHRGIHPENVLVVSDGDDVKIGGFGQLMCTSETEVPPRSNTVCYSAPPEVLLKGQGALGSELVDSWLIGCLMAELLTGKVLFEATDHEDESDQLHKIFGVLGVPDKEAMKDIYEASGP
ncbi:hypothetical protein PR202_ga05269 [Eleusine coracana subsp. coracana]|uniref:Protein kinase domain-containing protein n=1 Tax=Eleusine coracana subsp. coracana TaxID=191504 RepID=A0AAV5BSZ5_ELECO|nr:hypothetical protein PR202_ga04815 [Eleusine coracana subsp. coracana]GJM89120.1 hypothetical protein PR202_ga05269 [Eleusine coracana subsp. coracana]